jgi:hypothetical protein
MSHHFRRPFLPITIALMLGCNKGAPRIASGISDSAAPAGTPARGAPDTLGAWGSWILDGHPQFAGRFSIRGSRLLVVLDTMGDGPAHRWVPVDSVIDEVTKKETISTTCGHDTHSYSQETIGVVVDADTASVQVPRRAWFLDIGINKIRSLDPDSVVCVSEGVVD